MHGDNFCLQLNGFDSNIVTFWKEFQVEEDFCDLTLSCEDKQIKTHKIVLSSYSPVLRNILKFNLNPHPLIYLRKVKFRDLQNLLHFMYQGEVNIDEEDLPSFFEMAEDLLVRGLSDRNKGDNNSKSMDSFQDDGKNSNTSPQRNTHEGNVKMMNKEHFNEFLNTKRDNSNNFDIKNDFADGNSFEIHNNEAEQNKENVNRESFVLLNEYAQDLPSFIEMAEDLLVRGLSEINKGSSDSKSMNSLQDNGKNNERNRYEGNIKVMNKEHFQEFLNTNEDNSNNFDIKNYYADGNNFENHSNETEQNRENVNRPSFVPLNEYGKDLPSFDEVAEDLLVRGLSERNKGATDSKSIDSLQDNGKNNATPPRNKFPEGNKEMMNKAPFKKYLNTNRDDSNNLEIKQVFADGNSNESGQNKENISRQSFVPLNDYGKIICKICSKEFAYKKNLVAHIKYVHEGDSYSCDRCDYKANQKGNLKIHIESVHEGVRYPCNLCDYKATGGKSRLNKHTKLAHNSY